MKLDGGVRFPDLKEKVDFWSYLQALEFVLEEVELSHVHAELLLRVRRVVLPTFGRDVVLR